MLAQTVFLVWMTMITAIYGAVGLWLLWNVLILKDQMLYLYSLLEEVEYEETPTQLEQEFASER